MDNVDALKSQFLSWEQASRDTIDFKKAYVDMAGDLIAGLVLSQIIYWHLPSCNGATRLRVKHDGAPWIAKPRHEWYDEVRVTPKQLDRALGILEKQGLIATALYKFKGAPTKHVRLEWPKFLDKFRVSIYPKGENPFPPKGDVDFPQRVNSLTETTTKTTTEMNRVSPLANPPRLRRPVNASTKSCREIPPDEDGKMPVMQSNLAVLLLGTCSGAKISKKNREKLDQRVPTSQGEQLSPNEAYNTSPTFRAWLQETILPYFSTLNESGGAGMSHLVNLIRHSYELGKDNYFEYRERQRRQQQVAKRKEEQVPDVQGVPNVEVVGMSAEDALKALKAWEQQLKEQSHDDSSTADEED